MSNIQALENEIGLLKEEYEKFERGNTRAGASTDRADKA